MEFGERALANQELTHRERMEICLSGELPDRVPVSLWRHFPVDDQNPEGLAAATASFQKQFDFDFIKVTPSSSFCLKDWGSDDRWTGHTEGTREYSKAVINQPDDWYSLPILDPRKGHLGDQLTCLRLLTSEFSPYTPLVQTIFSPLAQAKNLIGKERLQVHIRKYPEAVLAGLERITETTLRFMEEAGRTGIDGIFYAVQHAQYGLLSTTEFEAFSKPNDLKILAEARGFWLNIAHLHGVDVMFDEIQDYPVQVINWHDRQTPPDLMTAKQKYNGILCGGLRQWDTMVLGTSDQVQREATDAIQATAGRRFILGTGCVLPVIAPYGNILAARQIVSKITQL
ncbi:MAG: uroporphyrinogen decarboxylase family protein [Anaerolineaceae bacterium]|nr:uroporphyrinogen decarboxylase family protein [Anaerolineaceae bacterium]